MRPILIAALATASTPAPAQLPLDPPASLGGGVGVHTMATTVVGSGQVLGRMVDEIGLHANHDLGFIRLRGGMPDCAYQLVYISLATQGGRTAYATALAARHSGVALPALS